MSRFFKKIIKNTLIISSGTLVSRLLGFARTILIAKFFGTSFLIEAFLVAFRLPNMFRSLLGEGAVDSVVIPVICEYKKKEEFSKTCGHLMLSSFTLLFLVVVLGVIFAQYIVMAIAPGFINNPAKFDLTVRVTQIIFSYLLFIGLSANLGGILYTKGNFFVPSYSPLILNVVVILGVLSTVFFKTGPIYVLACYVLAAGFLQFMWNFIAAKKYFSLSFNFKVAFQDSAIIKMLRLSGPRIWSVAVYHINVFVDTVLASFSRIVGEGAIAAIHYSNRLIQLPLALFSLAISRAVLPGLSTLRADNNFKDFISMLSFSFKNLAFFIVPCSVLFLNFSGPLTEVIFKRGKFDDYSLVITSLALFFYSFGLFFFAATRLLISTFHSLEDTKTPAKIATFTLIINIVLSILLMHPLRVGGLALASSISSAFSFVLLLILIQKRVGSLKGIWKEVSKILLASAAMGIVSKIVWEFLSNLSVFLKLPLVALIAIISYFFLSLLFRVETSTRMTQWVLKKK